MSEKRVIIEGYQPIHRVQDGYQPVAGVPKATWQNIPGAPPVVNLKVTPPKGGSGETTLKKE